MSPKNDRYGDEKDISNFFYFKNVPRKESFLENKI